MTRIPQGQQSARCPQAHSSLLSATCAGVRVSLPAACANCSCGVKPVDEINDTRRMDRPIDRIARHPRDFGRAGRFRRGRLFHSRPAGRFMVASSLSATPVSSGDALRTPLLAEPHLVLEITRGRTRFPLRPVPGPRYLIGAAVTCDLRLGGNGMPALHSLISVEDQIYTIEAIASDPPLKVNGERVQVADLRDGDLLEIGDVELTVRMVAGQSPASAQASGATIG
ncbi:MAG: FHA domain-containing protein, partial [Planctomycetaceae bacterium]